MTDSEITLELCARKSPDELWALQEQTFELHEIERQQFSSLHERFRAMCIVRYALKLKGQAPPASQCTGAFAFYEQVALGTLHPTLALSLHAHVAMMNALTKTPMADQEKIVRTQSVEVPRMGRDGTFEREKRKIVELSMRDQARVFGPDGVRSIEEQVAMMPVNKGGLKQIPHVGRNADAF